jgi:hypothetical protein
LGPQRVSIWGQLLLLLWAEPFLRFVDYFMKHVLVLLLTPRTAMATWEKDSPYANQILRNSSQGV